MSDEARAERTADDRLDRLERAVTLLCDAVHEAVRAGRPELEGARAKVQQARQLVARH